MSKVVLGILTGILIFIAAGILAMYWVGKMRREMEQKRPQVAMTVEAGRWISGPPSDLKYLEIRWSLAC